MAYSPVRPVFFSVYFLLVSIFLRSVLPASGDVNAVVAPVFQDPRTSLYTVSLGSNLTYLLELGGDSVWSVCPSLHSIFHCTANRCRIPSVNSSSILSALQCRGRICTTGADNPFTGKYATSELTYTNATLWTINGTKPGAVISFPRVLSSCAPRNLHKGLPAGTVGVLGLGISNLSLQSLLPDVARRFSMCLTYNQTSNPNSSFKFKPGVLHFGSNPYVITRGFGHIASFPLLHNPSQPSDYFIPINAVEVTNIASTPEASLLTHANVTGWVKLSTIVPYTILSTPIYRSVVNGLKSPKNTAMLGQFPARAVPPFSTCFNMTAYDRSSDILAGYLSMAVHLLGSNGDSFYLDSFVDVSPNVTCLAYIDGGMNPPNDIVIGLFQLKERFISFNLEAKTLEMSYLSVLSQGGSCASFMAQA